MEKAVKAKLIAMLVACGVIPREFTGRLVFNINAGALCDAERIERLK
jgi:hypothetical protein